MQYNKFNSIQIEEEKNEHELEEANNDGSIFYKVIMTQNKMKKNG